MKSPIGWEKHASKYRTSTSKTPSTTPTPHTRDPHKQTRKFTEMQTQLATTYVPTLHCTASELVSEKKRKHEKFPTLASKRTVHAKLARGSHMNLGHYMPDCQTKMQTQNCQTQEDCSKNRPGFSFLGGHMTGAPWPGIRSRAAILVPSSEFAP